MGNEYLLIPLLLALSACGGGGGGSAPSAAKVTVPVVKAAPIVDMLGDSTMRGYEAINGQLVLAANNAPSDLQALLGAAVTVQNNGVGGSTLLDGLNGVAGYFAQPWSIAVKTDPSQIVILNWAINDANTNSGETPASFEADLLQFVQIAQAAGKTVILEEPGPVCNTAYSALPQYVAVVDQVAAQLGLPLVKQYDYIQSLPNWQSYLGDCLHPADDRLYAIKAQREADVLAPLLRASGTSVSVSALDS